jgi:UDP-N-acetylmuramate: L-alanyl-gamma-D-glutamyl-meso-diaminopimelate ligase
MSKQIFLSGIGGIGMANLAVLLKDAGFDVCGSDGSIYEPAATILRDAGIVPLIPYAEANIPSDEIPIIIGNAQSRGHVEVEKALDRGYALFSFPEFLHRHILHGRHTVVVAGTHGKSTTTACVAHLLHEIGSDPGFLVGALPLNFPLGARLGGAGAPFVVEGDEYDSAFFDKRSKFLHYFPRTLLLGTVEYDHADIFPSEDEMLLSFRRLINLLPRSGQVIYNSDCDATRDLIALAPCETISVGHSADAQWRLLDDAQQLRFVDPEGIERSCPFELPGRHNRFNGLMALVAAVSQSANLPACLQAAGTFHGIHRRFEKLFDSPEMTVYDDFAHHPTAIAASLQAVRERHPGSRLIAVFEPRSNTMVRNIFQQEIPAAFTDADSVIFGSIHRQERIPKEERLDVAEVFTHLAASGILGEQVPNREISQKLNSMLDLRPTVVIFMSNGSFDGAPHEFVTLLANR